MRRRLPHERHLTGVYDASRPGAELWRGEGVEEGVEARVDGEEKDYHVRVHRVWDIETHLKSLKEKH